MLVGAGVLLSLAVFAPKTPSGASEACPLVTHVEAGPHGLLGATVNRVEPALDRYGQFYPEDLVLVRGRKVSTVRLNESVFIWTWIFWADGTAVAMDRSPLHFSTDYELVEIATGKVLAFYSSLDGHGDTVQGWDDPAREPAWVRALTARESADTKQTAPVPDCRFRLAQKR